MKRLIFSTTLLLSFTILFAQKKPLDHSVYDGWQSIGERMISNDGRWVVYTINAQEGGSTRLDDAAREQLRHARHGLGSAVDDAIQIDQQQHLPMVAGVAA